MNVEMVGVSSLVEAKAKHNNFLVVNEG